MANLVVHFEIHASEPQRAHRLLLRAPRLEVTQFGDMPYWSIDTGEGAIGNIAAQPGLGIDGGLTQRIGAKPEVGAAVNGCNIVVGVDDVDALMRRGVELGGTEALPADDMQGVGRVGYLLDPDGNVFGLISPVMSDGSTGDGVERVVASGRPRGSGSAQVPHAPSRRQACRGSAVEAHARRVAREGEHDDQDDGADERDECEEVDRAERLGSSRRRNVIARDGTNSARLTIMEMVQTTQ